MASCWVSVEPPLDNVVGAQILDKGAQRAENVDTVMLEKAAVLGRHGCLDQIFGNLLKGNGVVMQDAALADFVAVTVEELDGVLPGEKAGPSSNSSSAGRASA